MFTSRTLIYYLPLSGSIWGGGELHNPGYTSRVGKVSDRTWQYRGGCIRWALRPSILVVVCIGLSSKWQGCAKKNLNDRSQLEVGPIGSVVTPIGHAPDMIMRYLIDSEIILRCRITPILLCYYH